jgi:hypothetical protein
LFADLWTLSGLVPAGTSPNGSTMVSKFSILFNRFFSILDRDFDPLKFYFFRSIDQIASRADVRRISQAGCAKAIIPADVHTGSGVEREAAGEVEEDEE